MKTTTKKNNNEAGFTMVEFLVTMAVLGALAAIAIPSIINFRQNSLLNTATRELFSGFQEAKMTAIKRNEYCTITFDQNVDGETYDYVIYVDADNDVEYDAGETIIAKQLWDQNANMKEPVFTFPNKNDDGKDSITFTPQGLPEDNNGLLSSTESITLQNASTNLSKKLELSIVGNVKIGS